MQDNILRLKDNSSFDLADAGISPDEMSLLHEISGRSLRDLFDKGQIITIPDFRKDELRSDQVIVSVENGDRVLTGNIVGFIGNKQSYISILSRFANGETDLFIQYMLFKVLGINISHFNHPFSASKGLDILPFLFPLYLKKALGQGVYKPYIRIQHNNLKPKGQINVAEHFKHNIPFKGTIAYSTREKSEDNNITQLIRHTIETLAADKYYSKTLCIDRDTIKNIDYIRKITPSFNANDCRKVLYNNRRPLAHPYFTHYTPLQKICKFILERRKGGYGDSSSSLNGLLIDVSWLWEEYLGEILKVINARHPRNRSRKGAVYVANSMNTHPDIVFKKMDIWERFPDFFTESCVFDAKYKFISKKDIDRNDIHQLITYMYIMNKRHGALISPTKAKSNEYEGFNLNGIGGQISLLRMAVPQDCNVWSDFCNHIKNSEDDLLDYIRVITT